MVQIQPYKVARAQGAAIAVSDTAPTLILSGFNSAGGEPINDERIGMRVFNPSASFHLYLYEVVSGAVAPGPLVIPDFELNTRATLSETIGIESDIYAMYATGGNGTLVQAKELL